MAGFACFGAWGNAVGLDIDEIVELNMAEAVGSDSAPADEKHMIAVLRVTVPVHTIPTDVPSLLGQPQTALPESSNHSVLAIEA